MTYAMVVIEFHQRLCTDADAKLLRYQIDALPYGFASPCLECLLIEKERTEFRSEC